MRFYLAALVGALAFVPVAAASAPAVGALPKGPIVRVAVTAGGSFAIRLPKPTIKGGVWRVARAYKGAVATETSEQTLSNGKIAVSFRTRSPGTTRIVYALTKGETAHAYAARTWVVTVAAP